MNMLNREEYMTFWSRFDIIYSELDPQKGFIPISSLSMVTILPIQLAM